MNQKILNLYFSFINGGQTFSLEQRNNKSRFQMLNVALLLSSIGLAFGILNNLILGQYPKLIFGELGLLLMNFIYVIILRKNPNLQVIISHILTVELLTFFASFVIFTTPEDMKFVWIFTYSVTLFYFSGRHYGFIWALFLMVLLIIAQQQTFYPSAFTLKQIIYLDTVFLISVAIVAFFQYKIEQDEKLIVEKDKMLIIQSRQAAMGEMLSMIAHQWRQPLSTVTLQITNLKVKTMFGNSNISEVQEVLDHISDSVIYLADTIDDFQTYFKPNKNPEKIESCLLVDKVIKFIQPRLLGDNVHLNYICVENFELSTHVNAINQVLINILNNAADALAESDIENKEIIISIKREENMAVIQIEDNAEGIPEDILDRIFEPYFSTKTSKNGTGIGLYMARMIIEEQLKGRITADNVELGARFVLHIPLSVT